MGYGLLAEVLTDVVQQFLVLRLQGLDLLLLLTNIKFLLKIISFYLLAFLFGDLEVLVALYLATMSSWHVVLR